MGNDAMPEIGNEAKHHLLLDEVMEQLIDHRQAFHAFFTRRLAHAAFAEDFLQPCFMKALAHFHSIKKMDRIIHWLDQTAPLPDRTQCLRAGFGYRPSTLTEIG